MPDRLCTIAIKTNGIAIVTLTGNKALPAKDLLEALQKQILSISCKSDIKGILLTGSDKGFCISQTKTSNSPQEAAALSTLGQQVLFSLEKIGKPCICVIDGECLGLGLEVALASDFIIASHRAVFGFPGISAGLLPFCGGSQRLARLVGKSKTKEMIYSGELVDATEAHRIGLINRLYPDDEVLPKTEELLLHICSRSPNAIRIGGEVVNAGYDIDLQTACMLERDAFALCFASFDQREGMQAFLDKRPPQFKGE